jgi:hypothetical protein
VWKCSSFVLPQHQVGWVGVVIIDDLAVVF